MKLQQLPRIVDGVALVLAPLVLLVSTLALPSAVTGDAAQIALIQRHPDRWYLFALLATIASMLFVPAFLGLMSLARDRAPGWAILGTGLLQFGVLVSLADSATQLVYWQMGAPGASTEQMVALAHRYDTATGASVFFTVGGLSIVAGSVVVAVGLIRSRAVPVWAAVLLPVAMVANIVGFSIGSRTVLLVSCVLALAGLGRAAVEILAPSRPERRGAAVPATR